MAFCSKCGTQVSDEAKFCPSCGSALGAQNASNAQYNSFNAKLRALSDTADTTAEFDPADIQQNKVMGILAYLSWLVLIPILAAPKSRFARYHANQGLVLFILEIAWWIVRRILSAILYAISWRLGFISTILGLVNIAFLVLAILGIVNVANGRAKELPVIGKIRILQ